MPSKWYNGNRVSGDHYTVLKGYEKKYNAVAQVNDGRRTMGEQWQRWRTYQAGGALAAFPSPSAPHIKFGRKNHALDINCGSGRGQAQHVAAYYRSLGIPVAFNVASECWHMDTLSSAALARAARKLRKSGGGLPTLRRGRRGKNVVYLKKLLYDNGIRNFSGKKRASNNRFDPRFTWRTRDAVKRFQRAHKLGADGVVGPKTWRALKRGAKK